MPQSTTIGGRPGEPAPERPVPRIDRLGVLRSHGQWPAGGHDHHAIDVNVHRLRPRLREIGLVIHTLRGRGFLLETLLAA